MSATLATIRQEVSKRADEFVSGTATGGSTTTLADTAKLQNPDSYWNEAEVLFTSGTNDGVARRVSAFVSSTSTLTVYGAALAAAVAAGHTYDLRRRFPVSDVDIAINRAINVAGPDFREKVRVDVTLTADTYTYAVPISANPVLSDRGLVRVEYGDTSVNSTRPLAPLPAGLYEIIEDYDAASTNALVKTVALKFNPYTGYTLRLIFEGPLANLSAAADILHLDLPQLEFIYTQAVAELWRIEAGRTTGQTRTESLQELARSEAYADRLRRSLGLEHKQQPLKRTVFRVTGV